MERTWSSGQEVTAKLRPLMNSRPDDSAAALSDPPAHEWVDKTPVKISSWWVCMLPQQKMSTWTWIMQITTDNQFSSKTSRHPTQLLLIAKFQATIESHLCHTPGERLWRRGRMWHPPHWRTIHPLTILTLRAKFTILPFFIGDFLVIRSFSYSYGRAKRASGKNRYYLYGYIIRTLLKILFWWMHYSYVFEITILTGILFIRFWRYYSDTMLFWQAREGCNCKK